eukprot:3704866-Pyramimonas_sp.AAC.1
MVFRGGRSARAPHSIGLPVLIGDARADAFIGDLLDILLAPDGSALQAQRLDDNDSGALFQVLDFGGYAWNI